MVGEGDRTVRVLITGAAGTVASAMLRQVPAGHDAVVTVRRSPVAVPSGTATRRIELTDEGAVRSLVREVAPDVVVHTAASMGVRADVVDAADVVARACAGSGVALVHLSTDAVFDGDRPPYDESDVPDPVHDYGRWKLEAERRVLASVPDACITRSSLVVSLDPPDRNVGALLAAVRSDDDGPRWYHDEMRCAIRAADLAAALWALVRLGRDERAGVWHLPGPEVLSRLELARRICEAAGEDPRRLRSGSIRDHPGPRPADLTMRSSRADALGVRPSPVP